MNKHQKSLFGCTFVGQNDEPPIKHNKLAETNLSLIFLHIWWWWRGSHELTCHSYCRRGRKSSPWTGTFRMLIFIETNLSPLDLATEICHALVFALFLPCSFFTGAPRSIASVPSGPPCKEKLAGVLLCQPKESQCV